jgi:uncharacterized repeat protein (TIGR01451 family)
MTDRWLVMPTDGGIRMFAVRSSRDDPEAGGPEAGRGRPSRRRGIRAGLATILALTLMAVAAPAAMADPWPCDGTGFVTFYDASNPAQGTMLNRADRQPDDTYQLTEVGTVVAQHLNAIAFRPQDGFMYGFSNSLRQIMRIERNASGEATFTPIGLPPGSGINSTVVGAILADGTYFVWQADGGAIFDVSGPTAQLVTTVPATGAHLTGDVAVSPVDGQLYGVNSDNPNNPADNTTTWGVYRFALSGGTLTRGPRVADAGSFGGGFFQADGKYVMYANGTVPFPATPPQGAGLYSADFTTGQLTFLGSGPVLTHVDATACANGLALTKDASPRTVTAGTELTYTHTMTSRALQVGAVDFVDQLPAGLTYVPGSVTVSPQIGTPNNYGGTGTLAVSGTIAPQQTVTITARVRVAPEHACNVDVRNQSRSTLTVPGSPPIVVDSDDPTTPTDPTDPTTIRVICSADVGIVKTATTSPIVPGEDATFTLVATNHGPSTATNVRVSDQLPAQFSLQSATQGCAEAGGTLTCTAASLAPGASQTYTVTGRVASSLNRCLENTGTVISDTPDPNTGNNSSTICTPIEGRSNLSITKTASTATVAPGGGQVMYTLVVRNSGPSDDPNAAVVDPLAAGLTLVAAEASQGSCTTANNTVSCDLGRLRDRGSAQVLVTANVAAAAGCITNTAGVAGAHEDPTPDDNRASAQVCVQPPPEPPSMFDLEVDKRASATRVRIGQRVRYTVVVRNNGPGAAPDAQVTDTYNARATLVSVRTSQGTCARQLPIRCDLGRIDAGASATVTVVIKPRETGTARNAASATSCCGTDGDPSSNMDTADIRVRKVTLRITKVASRSSVQAGDAFSYRIRVRNPTRGEARNVRVCDRLPSGLRYVSSKPRARRAGAQRCWRIRTLGARKSRTFRVTVRAANGAIGRKVNRASAASRDAARRVTAREPVRVLGQATPVTG